MDFKKLLYGAVAAGIAAGAVTGGAMVQSGQELSWGAVLAAALVGVGLYLKDSNAHRGKDVRQPSKNPLKK